MNTLKNTKSCFSDDIIQLICQLHKFVINLDPFVDYLILLLIET